ncbi:MAG: transglycosylase SLT domain-containing protein [Bacteroidetes bacterium]|nr:transglycosylase SLT domain-containing protein [Bacteroidota bacterium]
MSSVQLKITNPEKHISQPSEINERYNKEEKTKLAGAAKDFESMLTQMMLKSMNKTTGGLFGGGEGFGGDYFDTIFESEISSYMSKGKGFGIADQIYKKLTGENLDLAEFNADPNKIGEKLELRLKNIGDQLPFLTPSEMSEKRVENFDAIIDEASKKYGVDTQLIKSVILTESAGNAKAVSSAKAKGLMQLMDGTAKDMGVKNSFDPKQNIMGGTKYLSKLIKKYDGDLKLSLAAYNAGPGAVDKHNGIPPFNETKTYVTRVLGYLNYLNG